MPPVSFSILVATTTSTAVSSLSCCLGQLLLVRKIHCLPFLTFFLTPIWDKKVHFEKPFCATCFSMGSGDPPAVIFAGHRILEWLGLERTLKLIRFHPGGPGAADEPWQV